MSGRVIRAADLFCGGGGTSTGLVQACEAAGATVDLVAINHWGRAVETHAANHPGARHFCARIDALDPKQVCPKGLDLLVASPECTHHSRARGGKPKNDQSRASGWDVLRWVETLLPRAVLLENVIEWQDWGPIGADGQALKSRKGETFAAFLAGLTSLGYRVECKVLNAADYGDATTRRRLFVQARRGRSAIDWPTPSHAETPSPMFGGARWRAAREVIDWTLPGRSIFAREKPLADNTLRRIAEGLRRFGSPALADAFLLHVTHGGRTHSVDGPLPTVTAAHRGELGLVQPFVVGAGGPTYGGEPRSTARPMGTVLTGDHKALVQPFIVTPGGPDLRNGRSVDDPLPTVTGTERFGVVEPYLVRLNGTAEAQMPSSARSVDDPVPAITGGGEHVGIAQPFLVPFLGEREGQAPRTRSVDRPVPTVTVQNGIGLAQPFLLSQDGRGAPRAVSEPSPTIVSKGAVSLVEPFLVEYHGNGKPRSVEEPVPTATTRDRLGLVEPARLDVLFRMLQPHELAAAMGFPTGYKFKGNRGDVIRQIGNAVAVNMARALCTSALALEEAAA